MEKLKILVSGASIAGPTLPFWLYKYGFEVTIVERAEELLLGGQNIDVKGPAKQVTEMMGLGSAIRAANTTEKGIRFVFAGTPQCPDINQKLQLFYANRDTIYKSSSEAYSPFSIRFVTTSPAMSCCSP